MCREEKFRTLRETVNGAGNTTAEGTVKKGFSAEGTWNRDVQVGVEPRPLLRGRPFQKEI